MANKLSKLPDLIEQTQFLLQRQRDAQLDCNSMFKDLLSVVKTKRASVTGDSEEAQALDQISSLISEQTENVTQEAQVDIDFLTEQLDSLKKIQQIKDPSQANEVLSMLIDEDEEIKNTAEFKKEITEEAAVSRQNLATMINDIKDSIQEGGAKEVALYLESILEGGEEGLELDFNEDDEDGCCDDDEEGGCCDEEEEEVEPKPCTCGKGQGGMCTCKSAGTQRMRPATKGGGCGGGCSGCSGGGCGTGCGSKSMDVFGDLEKYEKALLEEADEKVRH